eukprot:gene1936-2371_t
MGHLYQPLYFFLNQVLCTCRYLNGVEPQSGDCEGPIARLKQQIRSIDSNNGCLPYQVLYYLDGDKNQPKCGICEPGSSDRSTCGLNQYCTDEGTCDNLVNHPMYQVSCPKEVKGNNTKSKWCGDGLRCINHRCKICVSGEYNRNDDDGSMCIDGVWSYSNWDKLANDPTSFKQLIKFVNRKQKQQKPDSNGRTTDQTKNVISESKPILQRSVSITNEKLPLKDSFPKQRINVRNSVEMQTIPSSSNGNYE